MENDVELTSVREQHRFDEEKLRGYLQEHLDHDFEQMDILQFEGGQSNPTFQLNCAESCFVLRKKPPGKLLKSAHQVEREFRVMEALGPTTVPVPDMVHLCEDDSIIGTPFFLMKMVEGRVLTDNHLPSFTKADRLTLHKSFIESGAALHNIDYKAVGLETFGRPGNYYARQVHRWSEQYIASETQKNENMDAMIAWLPDNIPEDDESTIVHGDYRIPNCIIHPSEPKIIAMLDWELSTIGQPLADLSYWCSMLYHGELEFPDNPEEVGLMTEQETLDLYCELTNRPGVENWNFYLAFNLFRSAAIRQGVYKRGLDGNASSDQWERTGETAMNAADRAWALVQDAGLA
ncbi:MAG: phosphotransferase [Pseudomonadales bacterium]|jgi:aminoglycoside phosphotransferase (APT) family kinase protein